MLNQDLYVGFYNVTEIMNSGMVLAYKGYIRDTYNYHLKLNFFDTMRI